MPADSERGAGSALRRRPAGAPAGPCHVAGAGLRPRRADRPLQAGHGRLGARARSTPRRTRTCGGACCCRAPTSCGSRRTVTCAPRERAYERNPNVQYAEPNYIVQLFATPNDPAFPAQLSGPCTTPARLSVQRRRHPGRRHRRAGGVGRDDRQQRRDGRRRRHRRSHTTIPTSRRTSGRTRASPAAARRRTTSTTTETARSTTSAAGTSPRTTTIRMDYESHGTHVAGTIGAVGNNGGAFRA